MNHTYQFHQQGAEMNHTSQFHQQGAETLSFINKPERNEQKKMNFPKIYTVKEMQGK